MNPLYTFNHILVKISVYFIIFYKLNFYPIVGFIVNLVLKCFEKKKPASVHSETSNKKISHDRAIHLSKRPTSHKIKIRPNQKINLEASEERKELETEEKMVHLTIE